MAIVSKAAIWSRSLQKPDNLPSFMTLADNGVLDHFTLDGAEIVPQTPEGRVTVHILQLNHPDRLTERGRLMQVGRYPS